MERVDYQKLVVQEILSLHKQEDLNINPWYQRRSVWTNTQKAYLINTIFENKPVPSLYIRFSLDLVKEKTIREVVDGQQRVRSIVDYVANAFPARHPHHNAPVKYEQLKDAQKEAFLLTSMSVGYLLAATDSDVIEMFGRLNSVSKTLNLQEKRNALFSGDFKQFCLKESSSRLQLWRHLNIFSANEIARMGEIQFLSEIVINMMLGLQDYNAKQIDDSYRKYDEVFPEEKTIKSRMEKVFDRIASLESSAIRDTIFSRSPLFFSFFLILDSASSGLTISKIEDALHTIDEIFHSDTPVSERPAKDADFAFACSSNPHRIRSRKVRDAYIRSYLGL